LRQFFLEKNDTYNETKEVPMNVVKIYYHLHFLVIIIDQKYQIYQLFNESINNFFTYLFWCKLDALRTQLKRPIPQALYDSNR